MSIYFHLFPYISIYLHIFLYISITILEICLVSSPYISRNVSDLQIHQKWTKRRSESEDFGGNPMVGPAKLFMGVTMVTLKKD